MFSLDQIQRLIHSPISSCEHRRIFHGMQFAFGVIIFVGGITATFALVGYFPPMAAIPGSVAAGTAFVALIVVTVKKTCSSEYVFDVGEFSRESSSSRSMQTAESEEALSLSSDEEDVQIPQYVQVVSIEIEDSDTPRYDPFCYPKFPKELAISILSYLDLSSLCLAGRVNRTWYARTHEPLLWKLIYKDMYRVDAEDSTNCIEKCLLPVRQEFEREQIFTNGLCKIQAPPIKKFDAQGAVEEAFITDSFIIYKSEGVSILFNHKTDEAGLSTIQHSYVLSRNLVDRAIEIRAEEIVENTSITKMRIGRLEQLQYFYNKDVPRVEIKQKDCKRTWSRKTEDFFYIMWTSGDTSKQIFNRWNRSQEIPEPEEIMIDSRRDGHDKLLDILGIAEWKDQIVFFFEDGVREIWDPKTQKKVAVLSPFVDKKGKLVSDPKKYIVFENHEIFVGESNRVLCIRDLETGEIVFSERKGFKCFFLGGYKHRVLFAFVKADYDGEVSVFNLRQKKMTNSWKPTFKVHEDSFYLHANKLIVTSVEGEVEIVDPDSGKSFFRQKIFDSLIDHIHVCGPKLLFGSGSTLKIMDFSYQD